MFYRQIYNDELQALDSKKQANIFAQNVVNENAKYMNKQHAGTCEVYRIFITMLHNETDKSTYLLDWLYLYWNKADGC